MNQKQPEAINNERREMLKTIAYVTPVIITLAVTPTFASRGSGCAKQREWGSHHSGKTFFEDLFGWLG